MHSNPSICIGFSLANVDLEIGTAIFALNKDVEIWNDRCVRQIEEKYGDICEAVDIHGCDPRSKNSQIQRATRTKQFVETLKLRTCAMHRMRVMLLYNHNVQLQWANGTRARLLTTHSWTGKTQMLTKQKGEWENRFRFNRGDNYVAEARYLEENKNEDFMVMVVKDDESTILERIRFREDQIAGIHAKAEEDVSQANKWKQVPLKLAYALTGHKSQGLTMNTTYPSLMFIFGYGLPYTICTRTPYRHNMLFVGVPPKDIFEELVRVDDGLTAVDRQRLKLQGILADDTLLERELEKRLDTGKFNLDKIAEDREESLLECREHLRTKLRYWMQKWHDRLYLESGIKNMVLTTGAHNKKMEI